MAEAIQFICGGCRRCIEAWDDGHPYYLDASGAKVYAYHPAPERDRCIGNDEPHLCLACGAETRVDSQAPNTVCPTCGARRLTDSFRLDGMKCPSCPRGVFARDPTFFAIS